MPSPNDQTGARHVCILTTAHPVDDVRVNEKFAQSFLRAGFRVSWIGPGHAFVDERAAKDSPIEFHLVRPNARSIDRLMSGRLVERAAAAVSGVDCYYTPEPDAARIAQRLAKRNGAKVLLDIHENYHGPMLTRWLGRLAIPPIRELLRRRIASTCRQCDLVMGVSQSVLELYVGRASGLVVRSCAPEWFGAGPPAAVMATDRPEFRIMHGKRSLGRGTLIVIQAIGIAARKLPRIRVVMFGAADATDPEYGRLIETVRQHGAESALELRPSVPMRQMPTALAECDLGLIAYGRELGLDSLPNRIFEYMAAGLPVLIPVYSPEMVAIVERIGCGRAVDFENPAAVADVIVALANDPDGCREMGHRARVAFCSRHNWEFEVKPVIDYIERQTGETRG